MDKRIEIMLSELASEFMALSNVESVVLSGSFARDEGCIVERDGIVVPQKDFDIYLFVSGSVTGVGDIMERFRTKYNLDEHFEIIAGIIPVLHLSFLPPDISKYELKVHGKVLAGKDYLSRIKVAKEDIPHVAAWRLLANKVKALIFFNPSVSAGEGTYERMIYETQKTYVEIATVFSLFGDFYESTYEGRLQRLKDGGYLQFQSIFEKYPSLLQKIEFATSYRRNPSAYTIPTPERDWFEARDTLLYMFCFVSQRVFDFRSETVQQCVERLREVLPGRYYAPYFQYYFSRLHIPYKYLVNPLSWLTYHYQCDDWSRRRYENYYMFRMYLAGPCLLATYGQENDSELFHLASSILEIQGDWYTLRESYMKLFFRYADRFN